MEFKFCDTDYNLVINDRWQIVNKKPDDPKELSVIGLNHQNCYSIVFLNPIPEKEIMPIWDKNLTINSVRHYLDENQGIIEIDNNLEKFPFIYTIIKIPKQEHGNHYLFKFHIQMNNVFYQIDGMFDEMGVTGIRDNTIYEKCRRDGIVNIEETNGKINLIGWNEDPYDKNYKKGFLMNLSEKREFDEYFPYHPLSEARKLLGELIENFNKLYDNKK
jgi:hypothetical protein